MAEEKTKKEPESTVEKEAPKKDVAKTSLEKYLASRGR